VSVLDVADVDGDVLGVLTRPARLVAESGRSAASGIIVWPVSSKCLERDPGRSCCPTLRAHPGGDLAAIHLGRKAVRFDNE